MRLDDEYVLSLGLGCTIAGAVMVAVFTFLRLALGGT